MKPKIFVFDITHYECREVLADNEDTAIQKMEAELKADGYDLQTTDYEIVESYTPTKGDLE